MLTSNIVIQKIQQFSPEKLEKILEYIEFLEYQDHPLKSEKKSKSSEEKEQDFFALAGIWEGKSVTQETIRKNAWGEENQ
ncbi:MAG: DUF2281 domain-containing protein [Cyanobacteria bacterium RI_101]|nr:DUF2281 domain-containing protein [Cyanobacteria bacterium RI_101]